jgi:hypothetical protein
MQRGCPRRPDANRYGIQPEELAVTSVYRITIDEWSGKQKVVAADHPGAFLYGQVPAAASPREA